MKLQIRNCNDNNKSCTTIENFYLYLTTTIKILLPKRTVVIVTVEQSGSL